MLVTARRLGRRLRRRLVAGVCSAAVGRTAGRAVRERARRTLRAACAAFSRANARVRAAAAVGFSVSGASHKKGRRRKYANNLFHSFKILSVVANTIAQAKIAAMGPNTNNLCEKPVPYRRGASGLNGA